MSAPDRTRLRSTLSTLLSQAHERSVALRLAPAAPSLTRPIVRALPAFLAGLHALPRDDERQSLMAGWERVRTLLEEDEEGRQIALDAMAIYEASDDEPPLASPNPLERTPYGDEPYRDEPTPPPPDVSASARTALYQSQQSEMAAQDGQLDALSLSIARQRELGIQMGDELELHGQLLEEMDSAVDGTANRLGRARGRMDTLERSLKQNTSSYVIGMLIVSLILIIYFFK